MAFDEPCMHRKLPASQSSTYFDSRDMIAFGMKGAALAAFGEIPTGAFFTVAGPLVLPFGDKKEGVKLGESTLSVFLG